MKKETLEGVLAELVSRRDQLQQQSNHANTDAAAKKAEYEAAQRFADMLIGSVNENNLAINNFTRRLQEIEEAEKAGAQSPPGDDGSKKNEEPPSPHERGEGADKKKEGLHG